MSDAAGTSPIRLSSELTIFHDVAKALTSSLNLDSILQTIMEKMGEYFRPDTWSLLMVDEDKDELYFAIAVGAASDVLSKVRLKVGEGIAGWVARHGQVLIVPDVQSDPRFSSRLDDITRLQTPSKKFRNSPSPTTAPASSTPAIFTRPSKPRSTAPPASVINSALSSSTSTTSSPSTTLMDT